MVRIVLDAMGGDHAPQATCEGAALAMREMPQLHITLAGVASHIEPLIHNAQDVRERITLLEAPELITNHESAALAIRQKKDSAIVKGMLMVRDGEADGFVSAGSTGAVLVGGMLRLGRVPGIERPAIAPMLPGRDKGFLLIDAGANVDCKPDYLAQFALMGDAYMRRVMNVALPAVGLLNNGAEEEKGSALYLAAHQLLKHLPIHFVGNVEGRNVPEGQADVVVCDGFDGNIILKYTEGIASALLARIKRELMADVRSKIGALLAKPAFRRVRMAMDYTEVGGAPLLGVAGSVVKAHGSSDRKSIASALRQAVRMHEGGVASAIAENLSKGTKTEG